MTDTLSSLDIFINIIYYILYLYIYIYIYIFIYIFIYIYIIYIYIYIYIYISHPPSVLKQIPKSVSTRITANSCNEDIFRKSAPFYDSILQDCGFNENIKYCPEESVSSRRRKNRSRNIIWYNPPFSKNIKTNFGKHFFNC